MSGLKLIYVSKIGTMVPRRYCWLQVDDSSNSWYSLALNVKTWLCMVLVVYETYPVWTTVWYIRRHPAASCHEQWSIYIPSSVFDSEWLWCNFIMKNRPDIMYGKCDNIQTKIKLCVSSDVIRRHWPWITLVREMAWFLTATIHWHLYAFTCQLKLLFLKDRWLFKV